MTAAAGGYDSVQKATGSNMKIFALDNARTKGLIFDIDLTLYDNRHYYDLQERLITDRLASAVGLPAEKVMTEVRQQRDHVKRHTGKRPPLGVTIQEKYGITMVDLVRWREELFHPEHYLSHDFKLEETIRRLHRRFKIAAVTNNPTTIARRTLKTLGVDSYFEPVIGVDVTFESKPTMAPFLVVLQSFGLTAANTVSIGDRYEVDLELPLQAGMGGILIESLDDVYRLPKILEA